MYHKQEMMREYLGVVLTVGNMKPASEEILRRNTIPWLSELNKAEKRNTKIAASGLMNMVIKMPWNKLQVMPKGGPRRTKKPQPLTTKTKVPGRYSRDDRSVAPKNLIKTGRLSEALKILKQREKEDTEGAE